MEAQQGNFEGWAVVELMGHQREIGYVTTEVYGAAALFRVDVPEIPEREYTLEFGTYIDGKTVPAGSKVAVAASPARSRLVNPSAIYALNPCTEATARELIQKQSSQRPLILLELAERKQLEVNWEFRGGKDWDQVAAEHDESD